MQGKFSRTIFRFFQRQHCHRVCVCAGAWGALSKLPCLKIHSFERDGAFLSVSHPTDGRVAGPRFYDVICFMVIYFTQLHDSAFVGAHEQMHQGADAIRTICTTRDRSPRTCAASRLSAPHFQMKYARRIFNMRFIRFARRLVPLMVFSAAKAFGARPPIDSRQ